MEQNIHEPEMGLTFEKVWQMFQETDRKWQETDKRFQETDRKWQETDKRFQETDRKISKLGSRIGDLIEHLATANILEKFEEFGYQFSRISRNIKIKDTQKQVLAELDILLENGEFAMVVEVKSLFTLGDVKDHIKRMTVLRQYANDHNDMRKYLAATAGALIDEKARIFALNNGMYVIEQSGDTVQIAKPETVKVW
jgi:hypothetical protein